MDITINLPDETQVILKVCDLLTKIAYVTKALTIYCGHRRKYNNGIFKLFLVEQKKKESIFGVPLKYQLFI